MTVIPLFICHCEYFICALSTLHGEGVHHGGVKLPGEVVVHVVSDWENASSYVYWEKVNSDIGKMPGHVVILGKCQ